MKTNRDSITIGFIVKTERRKIKPIEQFLKNEEDMKIIYIKTSRNKLLITELREKLEKN